MYRNINICGIDGVGKTVLAKELALKLKYRFTYEPSGETHETKILRDLALSDKYNINKYAREYLMCANRAISSQDRKDFLAKDSSNGLVSDRGLLSGFVYAHTDSGFSYLEWRELHKYNFNVLKPDLIVYIETAKQKIDVTDGDIYDGRDKEFFDRLNNSFIIGLDLFRDNDNIPYTIFYNDFNKSVEDNADRLIKQLEELK